MHGDGANPVERNEVPCQRSANGGDVDQARSCAVAEVGEAEVEEVDDNKQFREPEMGADPEVNEAEEKQV
jgi:hypothetical protein